MLTQAQGPRLYALNAAAAAQGLAAGQPLADARGICPGLQTAPADPAGDLEALGRLARWCERYTPWCAVDRSHEEAASGLRVDGLWLDITGCSHLFGGEAALLEDLVRRLAAQGLHARTGLAPTPGAAWAVARQHPADAVARRIVPPGGLAEALAPLPVQGLRLGPGVRADLARFGLKRIRDLAGLPRSAVYRRFDARGLAETLLRRLDQAYGRREEPIAPPAPPPDFQARRLFAEPMRERPGIEAALDLLLEDLMPQLHAAGRGARLLALSGFHADGRVSRLQAAASAPSRDPAHWRRLFAEKLDGLDPGFGLDAFVLEASRHQALDAVQAGWDGGDAAAPDPRALARLIDRLAGRFGNERIARVCLAARHLPEQAERRRPALAEPPPPDGDGIAPPAGPPRPFRLFARPEPLEVIAEVPDGPPLRFRWRRRLHQVARAQGPERIAPPWWQDDAAGRGAVRDYYRVEDEAGRRFWLFRDGLYGEPRRDGPPRWYLHGLFA